MCGIFGLLSSGSPVTKDLVARSTDTLAHRGPDDFGFFCDGEIGLGHRRLSIIDLEGGHQPIFNEDLSKCIIFNGEIYNFLGLRNQLSKKGHRFSTRSDTETILHAYEEWGESCVDRLRGMFAFAIWDLKGRSLFLARDRFGIKPLFYGQAGGAFSFASEMKAILGVDGFPREMDEAALVSYFTLGYIPAPLTIYRKIRKLLPGHTLIFKNGRMTIRKYWDLPFTPDRDHPEGYFIERFLELLGESVKMRMISEVPVGAFLSGGIDSSTVVALMSMVSESPVRTFCIGFGGNVGGYLDERAFAREVSDLYQTDHREYEVFPAPEGLVEEIVRSFDEPFADDSAIPSYYVCKIARENVTVALSGLGGDEMFGGYERYLGFRLARGYRRIPGFFREGLIRRFVESLRERKDGHYTVNHLKRFVRSASNGPALAYLGYLSKMDSNIGRRLFSDSMYSREFQSCRNLVLSHFNSPLVAEGVDSPNRAFYCDMKTYLPEDILAVTDRMSMRHALEVRVPFLDHQLAEFCATIPPEMKMRWMRKKYLLKRAVRDLLPESVVRHRKQGFTGPMAQWLKAELKPYAVETLSEENLKKHGLFNTKVIKTTLEQHLAGKEIHDAFLWSLLIFQSWFDLYIEKNPTPR